VSLQGPKDLVALLINQKVNDSDSIDKKVLALQKIPEVSATSVYENYIFVSPELGLQNFQDSFGSYGYDPGVKKTVAKTILDKANTLGIDTKKYTIVNPYTN
jgi:hypothetical protein